MNQQCTNCEWLKNQNWFNAGVNFPTCTHPKNYKFEDMRKCQTDKRFFKAKISAIPKLSFWQRFWELWRPK